MSVPPEVWVERVEFGEMDRASALNPRIARGGRLLRAALRIRWSAPDPLAALERIESVLAAFSPSFRRHQCRGPSAYHVFRGARERDARPDEAAPDGDMSPSPPFDACLALAHLIEHALIDFESAITEDARISGATGARRDAPGRYDILVECRDRAVGGLCLAMAVAALAGAADGRPPGRAERDLLEAARLARSRGGRPWSPEGAARALGWPRGRAEAALAGLGQLGYLAEIPYSMNFSGVPLYAVRPA